jgi:hypothetical protein
MSAGVTGVDPGRGSSSAHLSPPSPASGEAPGTLAGEGGPARVGVAAGVSPTGSSHWHSNVSSPEAAGVAVAVAVAVAVGEVVAVAVGGVAVTAGGPSVLVAVAGGVESAAGLDVATAVGSPPPVGVGVASVTGEPVASAVGVWAGARVALGDGLAVAEGSAAAGDGVGVVATRTGVVGEPAAALGLAVGDGPASPPGACVAMAAVDDAVAVGVPGRGTQDGVAVATGEPPAEGAVEVGSGCPGDAASPSQPAGVAAGLAGAGGEPGTAGSSPRAAGAESAAPSRETPARKHPAAVSAGRDVPRRRPLRPPARVLDAPAEGSISASVVIRLPTCVPGGGGAGRGPR